MFWTHRLEEGWTGSIWDTFAERSCLKIRRNNKQKLLFSISICWNIPNEGSINLIDRHFMTAGDVKSTMMKDSGNQTKTADLTQVAGFPPGGDIIHRITVLLPLK